MNPLEARLIYPHQERIPTTGEKLQLAPGVYWIRFPLPFALDHINLWLLRDQFEGRDGFTLIDCGIASPTTRDMWEAIIAHALEGLPLVRIIGHPYPSRPHRQCRLARRALWRTALDDGGRVHHGTCAAGRS